MQNGPMNAVQLSPSRPRHEPSKTLYNTFQRETAKRAERAFDGWALGVCVHCPFEVVDFSCRACP